MQTAALPRANLKSGGSTPADTQSLAAAGIRGFFGIAEKWRLGEKENLVLLGEPSRATYYNWKKGEIGKVSRDTLDRLSYIVGIYKALQILIPDMAMADAWVKRENDAPIFSGHSPLQLMLTGQLADLYRVRAYLDANRGSWD